MTHDNGLFAIQWRCRTAFVVRFSVLRRALLVHGKATISSSVRSGLRTQEQRKNDVNRVFWAAENWQRFSRLISEYKRATCITDSLICDRVLPYKRGMLPLRTRHPTNNDHAAQLLKTRSALHAAMRRAPKTRTAVGWLLLTTNITHTHTSIRITTNIFFFF
jgi:hypothetical protein